MTYNLTITGKGFVPLMQTANRIVGNNLGIGLLIMYVVIAIVISKNYQSKRGFLGSMYFGLVLAVLFRMMGILSDTAMFGSFALFVLALIGLYLSND